MMVSRARTLTRMEEIWERQEGAKGSQLGFLGSKAVCGCELAMSSLALGDSSRIQLVFCRQQLQGPGLVSLDLLCACEEAKAAGVSKIVETSAVLSLCAYLGFVALDTWPYTCASFP